MKTFLAFFDVLGFKEFIFNNEMQYTREMFMLLLQDSQTAVSGEKCIETNMGMAPDLQNQKVNCLHVSDSIIFWTDSDTEDDFAELVKVCYSFYWRSLKTTFPIRGCLVYGEIDFSPFTIDNRNGKKFYNYSLFGKGLIDGYLKAESINYAGCFIDETAIEKVSDTLVNDLIYAQKICYYKVPFKDGSSSYEHVFRPVIGEHNDVSFRNSAKEIKRLFTNHINEQKLSASVILKMNNTIDFLEYFRETKRHLENPNKPKE
jgi:hypothetical protein